MGTGLQTILMAIITIIFAALGFLSPGGAAMLPGGGWEIRSGSP